MLTGREGPVLCLGSSSRTMPAFGAGIVREAWEGERLKR